MISKGFEDPKARWFKTNIVEGWIRRVIRVEITRRSEYCCDTENFNYSFCYMAMVRKWAERYGRNGCVRIVRLSSGWNFHRFRAFSKYPATPMSKNLKPFRFSWNSGPDFDQIHDRDPINVTIKWNTLSEAYLCCGVAISRLSCLLTEVIRLPSSETNLDAIIVDFSGGPVVPEGMLDNFLPWRFSFDFLLTFRSDETTISSKVCPKMA